MRTSDRVFMRKFNASLKELHSFPLFPLRYGRRGGVRVYTWGYGAPVLYVDNGVLRPHIAPEGMRHPFRHLFKALPRLSSLTDVVAVCGKAFSGKSHTAGVIMDCYRKTQPADYFSVRSMVPSILNPLAAPVKDLARRMGWDGRKDYYGRQLLQRLGTECGRAYNVFTWSNMWLDAVGGCMSHGMAIADDVRFPDELFIMATLAKLLGIRFTVVRVDAPAQVIRKRRYANGDYDPSRHTSEKSIAKLGEILKRDYYQGTTFLDIVNDGELDLAETFGKHWRPYDGQGGKDE